MAKSEGGHNGWADKHPAYDLVNGPSGKGVDDLYTPEITNVGGLDNTVSVVCTVNNDYLKVQGILQRNPRPQARRVAGPGTPTVFGMNFQAVSVGQKLAKGQRQWQLSGGHNLHTEKPGGYKDGAGTPDRQFLPTPSKRPTMPWEK